MGQSFNVTRNVGQADVSGFMDWRATLDNEGRLNGEYYPSGLRIVIGHDHWGRVNVMNWADWNAPSFTYYPIQSL